MKIVEMSVSKFAGIQDNPRQRDTERHARKAKGYLRNESDTHRLVSVAELPDGKQFKLDGHTRCYLWEHQLISPPLKKLKAVVYSCKTMEEVKELYVQFDNAYATENSSDRLSGAIREHNIQLQSNMLKGYDFAQALKCVNREGLTEYALVGIFANEIAILDSWMLPQKRPVLGKPTKIHTCIKAIAIALLSTGEDEAKVHTFISGVVRDEGSIKAGSRDGIAWASELWTRRSSDGAISGWDNLNQFLDELLWCYRMTRHRKNAPGLKAKKDMTGKFMEMIAR